MHRRNTRNETLEKPSRNEPSSRDKSNNENEIRNSAYRRFCERISFMKYIFIILIIPPILNYASLKRESSVLLPAEGEQIDMGWGQKMFISCIGKGVPTIILDAPTGGTSDVWYLVQQQLSKISKVCVYDRAGLGFSDLPFVNEINRNQKTENRKFVSQVATLEQMTCDLHHLVTVARPIDRPFIMVGSETGALIARHYSLTYPGDVSDIILLNPLVEDLFWRQKEDWNNYWNMHLLPSLQSLQLSAYVGISRIAALLGWLKPDVYGGSVPKEVELRQLSHLCNPSHMSAVFHEHLLLNTSFVQMNEVWQTKPFPTNISVSVINSRQFEKIPSHLQKAWQQSQLYLRQSLHPTASYYITDGTAGQLYNEPVTICSKVQKLVYDWRLKFETYPTVHTFREHDTLFE
ncbi:uncharacterized protein LOC129971525 [Argiope bruennichi]|uniref:Uncharacterized protein n=1 Tax=Argiope bruennichi TaxID=94029 RepID=A0A8T0FCB1_ARGBR|nr:uncharacterized protein LOC129971525 [Argiope bruennichi]KAF8786573.1 hypothetical protein HNY73_008269 [Argiope bruennichi]